jgi:hypothetical protein
MGRRRESVSSSSSVSSSGKGREEFKFKSKFKVAGREKGIRLFVLGGGMLYCWADAR